ncbi:hypothetical protein ACIBLB_35680 [Streptosporangium canum]|uniref:hypothetical protein n=1 Tax=Streptosporangium canum TaxID=324952 RepID=UPI0037A57968
MVLACNALGATAVARTQLERWSFNRESSNQISHLAGMSKADHYTKIWHPESPGIPAGVVWAELSELLHGRGPLLAAAHWEATNLADPGMLHQGNRYARVCLTASQLSLRQILLAVVTTLKEAGVPRPIQNSLLRLPLSLPSTVELRESRAAVWPLTYRMLSRIGPAAIHMMASYLDDVRQLASGARSREVSYSARALEAFSSRRGRAIQSALAAFEDEKLALGNRFDIENLDSREFAYIILNESASLLAGWTTGPVSDALAVASAALRSAFWLWLEDDDRSMVLARTVVEQTARLRTWRTKPEKAAAIESRGSLTSVRDWLDGAGWRRLSVLNRSLGEFSHASPNASWSGARAALATIQRDKSSEVPPEVTARGGTLNEIAYAFGLEVYQLFRSHYPLLSEAVEEVLPYEGDDASTANIEEWLTRCWSHRDISMRA